MRKVIIPAAGKGIRMEPVSSWFPKEMLPIVTIPAISFVIEEFVNIHLQEFIFVINRMKSPLNDYIEHLFKTRYIHKTLRMIEQPEPLGLGHAILLASEFIEKGEYFFVALPDNIIYPTENTLSSEMYKVFMENRCYVIGYSDVPKEEASSRAILKMEDFNGSAQLITKIVDKPHLAELTATELPAIAGRYILNDEIFPYISNLSKYSTENEIELTAALSWLCKHKNVLGVKQHFGKYDIGSKLGYYEAFIQIGKVVLDGKRKGL